MNTDILLSTYNGAAFLEELLRSLAAQSFTRWRLLVRDDGSVDETMDILKSFQEKNRGRVFILEDNKHLGPKKSFEVLLTKSNAETMMFCDQDDVWLPDKIKNTLTKLKELEKDHPGQPVLVFSDLKVVDNDLKIIYPSFWQYIKVKPENSRNIYRLLINNPVVGCTVMINRQAKKAVLPFPEQAVMHDWWMALNVSRKGVTGYLDQPTILYRVHDKNSIGASYAGKKHYAGRLKNISVTFSQNKDALNMLKALDFPLSQTKFWAYKTAISFSKLF